MSDTVIVALITLFGGGGAWQYIRMSEANRVLAGQAKDTIAAKDREIQVLQSENSRLWEKNGRLNSRYDELLEHLTRPVQSGSPDS